MDKPTQLRSTNSQPQRAINPSTARGYKIHIEFQIVLCFPKLGASTELLISIQLYDKIGIWDMWFVFLIQARNETIMGGNVILLPPVPQK